MKSEDSPKRVCLACGYFPIRNWNNGDGYCPRCKVIYTLDPLVAKARLNELGGLRVMGKYGGIKREGDLVKVEFHYRTGQPYVTIRGDDEFEFNTPAGSIEVLRR